MSPSDRFDPSAGGPGDPAFRERLTAYLDGELSPAESREVLAWLERNPRALKELEEHRRVWALLGKYGDEPVPAGFAERVLAGAGAAPAGEGSSAAGVAPLRVLRGVRRVGRAARFAAVAATVVLAVGAGLWIARREAPPSSPAGTTSALEGVPTALLESEAAVNLANFTDEEFETILQGDPEDLVFLGRGGG
jgi:anti-sigma factor RsiW